MKALVDLIYKITTLKNKSEGRQQKQMLVCEREKADISL